MRKNSVKGTRINAEVHRELADIIRSEIKDPRVKPMTSVTEVEVTPDLKYCTAYISVLGDDAESEACLEGLRNAAGFIRRELAARINLRNTPELRFQPDNSLAYGMKMSKLIDEVMGNSGTEPEKEEN